MSNIQSIVLSTLGSLVASVTGAFIGFMGAAFLLQAEYEVNYAIDNEAALVEVLSANQIIDSLLESNPFFPKYKLLNYEVDWKKALLNHENEYLTELITEFMKLDLLRDVILQTEDPMIKEQYINEYKEEIEKLKYGGFIHRRINDMKETILNQDTRTDYFD